MRAIPVGLCILALSAASASAQSRPAPAYLVAEYEIIDPAGMKAWGAKARALAEARGGQFLAVGSKVAPVVGAPPQNATIIRFESMDKARAHFDSAEYKALAPERDKSAKFRTYLVEGTGAP
jgi:uncharacterized protein (DUF1330 family)